MKHSLCTVTVQYNLYFLQWLWNVILFLKKKCTLSTVENWDSEMSCEKGAISQCGGAWKCVTLFCFSSSSEFKNPSGFVERRPPHFDDAQCFLVTCLLASRDDEIREDSISILILVWACKYKLIQVIRWVHLLICYTGWKGPGCHSSWLWCVVSSWVLQSLVWQLKR